MFTKDDMHILLLESERLMYAPPTGPMGDALYDTIVAQSQKAHARLRGCMDHVVSNTTLLEDTVIQGNVSQAVLSLTVANILLAENLPEGPTRD